MLTSMILILMGLLVTGIFFLEALYHHSEYRNSEYHSFCGKQHKRNRNQYLLIMAVGVLIVVYNILVLVFA